MTQKMEEVMNSLSGVTTEDMQGLSEQELRSFLDVLRTKETHMSAVYKRRLHQCFHFRQKSTQTN